MRDLDKKFLRKALRQRRRSLSIAEQEQTARAVAQTVRNQDAFTVGEHVALYMATDGEVSTLALLDDLIQQGKSCYLPMLQKETTTLQFRQYLPDSPLVTNIYGLLEPDTDATVIEPRQLDNVFLPLVGFDDQGNRLGMGKGYYDRSFAFIKEESAEKPVLIGLAHESQKVEDLEASDWDVPLGGIITGQQMYLAG